MEPISAIALSLALGAGATAGKEVVGGLVKDAYAALKDRIKQHYPKVSVEQLGKRRNRRAGGRSSRRSGECRRRRDSGLAEWRTV